MQVKTIDFTATEPIRIPALQTLAVLLRLLQEIFDALIRTTASSSLGALSSLRISRHFDFLRGMSKSVAEYWQKIKKQ